MFTSNANNRLKLTYCEIQIAQFRIQENGVAVGWHEVLAEWGLEWLPVKATVQVLFYFLNILKNVFDQVALTDVTTSVSRETWPR